MISVFVSGVWMGATVLVSNPKTFWVSLPDGHIIKRHPRKHRMTKYDAELEVVDEGDYPFGYLQVLRPSWWRRLWNWLTYKKEGGRRWLQ